MRRLDLDEVDVQSDDLGDELRQRVQPRIEPVEVVLGAPVAHEFLHRPELHALRVVGDRFPLRPPGGSESPAKIDELLLRDVDAEWANGGLGPNYAPGGHGIHIDDSVLDQETVEEREEILNESRASAEKGQ